MPINAKKLAAFANKKDDKAPPFGKRKGKMGKGFPPPPKKHDDEDEEDHEHDEHGDDEEHGKGAIVDWAKEEEQEHEHGGHPKHKHKGKHVDVDAIGDRVQSGHGDAHLLQLASDVDEEHNPPDMITDEAIWEKAKKAVEPKWDDYDEPYAVVMHVYKEMGGGFKGGQGHHGKGYEGGADDEDGDEE
jgi:hypothetical protein